MERQLFFKKPLVTHGLHQNGSPCIPGLSWMREKSWSGIDLSTSEGLGHSSGGMFVLLGRSNVSQMRLWGWKPGQFRKGPDILEHHMLNMSQQPQTILKNVMFQCINRSRSCRTWEATLPLWNMFARPQLEWDVQFLAPYVGSRAGGSWVDRDGAVYNVQPVKDNGGIQSSTDTEGMRGGVKGHFQKHRLLWQEITLLLCVWLMGDKIVPWIAVKETE